ncbi:Transaldolase / Glucose-6-phosphate isomerase [Sphingobium indicum BiD32]|uniref:Transaldolase n=1 Tax=Sphingobium indicum BiD32 TaxID=1301087 RepID=N1MJC5_9SPHN|nr:bifunctional transaldolase/phosoglucose isomerase [Sphingobium indicum]CCW17051.1 Transaldolase / Glucose-6-phosphate isomerase [Sphingobium indicum BiD32]
MTSLLRQLHASGQAIWLDFLDRQFLAEGGLRKLALHDGVTGVTSNPSIFEKAMGHGDAYDPGFRAALAQGDIGAQDLYESQAIEDIRAAAADLRPVYERLNGRDGYVSMEVSPYISNDTGATIAEAQRLWHRIGVPNLMIKVPGNSAGVPAVRQLTADGVNVNITLLFAIEAYQAVAEAYMAGLEARLAKGDPIDRIASVASFFVSRIDARIDKTIDARLAAGDREAEALTALRGKVAIANAKLAYAWYQEMIESKRWRNLAAQGAMPQRLLWASTGVKDPRFPDTLYVDTLIGPDTINTMPPQTMAAFRDHGTLAQTLAADLIGAQNVLAEVDRLGLDLAEVTASLVSDGVNQFAQATDALLGTVAAKRAEIVGDTINTMTATLPEALRQKVEVRLEMMRKEAWPRRLWEGDPSLWTGKGEDHWLGWLAAGQERQVDPDALVRLREHAQTNTNAVLLGMGGSSLGPEVLARILGNAPSHPRLHVLDTTDPAQITEVARSIDLEKTLFIVSSKSGSTMEPALLRSYFFALSGRQGDQFIAVTDPGSDLEKIAMNDRFAQIFSGDPTIGGRYSVLSVFGMVPAAVIGRDVMALYAAASPMVLSCGGDVPPQENPGLWLGAIIGEAATAGRDKLTIVASARLEPLGAWLEQLLAESTGKNGHGIVPVDLEPLGDPASYGDDRLFVHFALTSDVDAEQEAKLNMLEAAGQPIVRISLAQPERITQEFFRWEIATAIAGAIIGINPFDQPDVEAAKVAARQLVAAYETAGTLEPETPVAEDENFAIFALQDESAPDDTVIAMLRRHFAALEPGNYAGFLAYLERNASDAAALAMMRVAVRDARRVATVAGFGPRFLHSTGQAYKGGPNSGVFLVITRDPDPDLAIPGHKASFGTVQLAQARGDAAVLAQRGRRVLRLHLKKSGGGLEALQAAIAAAL